MKMSSLSWKVLLVLILSGIGVLVHRSLYHNNAALGQVTSTPSPSPSPINSSYHDNVFPSGGGLGDRLLGVLDNRFSQVPAGLDARRRAGDYFNRNQLEDAQYAIEQSYNAEHRYYSNRSVGKQKQGIEAASHLFLYFNP